MQHVVVGTRGSALAVRQTEMVVATLRERHPGVEFEIRRVQTEADRHSERPLSQLGDKGVFVRSLERALLADDIQVAVHSLKDVPSDQETEGLELAAFPYREDARDALVSRENRSLAALPSGARVATSSLRRRAQLREMRPDLEFVDVRGNVDTRLHKLDEAWFDALVIAAAGMKRLGLAARITEFLPADRFIPDAGQGTLAVQSRCDSSVLPVVKVIDDPVLRIISMAERSVVRALGADCRSPVGAHAVLRGGEIEIVAVAAAEDGSKVVRDAVHGPVEDGAGLGEALGERLRRRLAGN